MATMLKIERGLAPFEDNSGFNYRVSLESDDGSTAIYIKSSGDACVRIEAEEWPDVRDAIDEMLKFAGGVPQ